jgi:hypothetical protein
MMNWHETLLLKVICMRTTLLLRLRRNHWQLHMSIENLWWNVAIVLHWIFLMLMRQRDVVRHLMMHLVVTDCLYGFFTLDAVFFGILLIQLFKTKPGVGLLLLLLLIVDDEL